MQTLEYTWGIVRIEDEAPNVKSLYLKPQNERPDFKAGQYLTVKIPGLSPAEGKAYSISSAPHEELVRLTVRKLGSFSTAILVMEVGDTLTTSAPYGFFFPEPDDKADIAFIIGGIGITPCLGVIKDLTQKGDSRHIHLLYSNQTEADTTFKEELTELASENKNFSCHHFITRETPVTDGFATGRMTADKIVKLIPEHQSTEFFICGSINFTKSLWKKPVAGLDE